MLYNQLYLKFNLLVSVSQYAIGFLTVTCQMLLSGKLSVVKKHPLYEWVHSLVVIIVLTLQQHIEVIQLVKIEFQQLMDQKTCMCVD